MKTYMTHLTAFGLLLFVSLGCEPRPVGNDPNVPDDIETDVDMNDEADDDTDIVVPPTTPPVTTPPVTTPPTEAVPPADAPAGNAGTEADTDVNIGGTPNTNP